MDGGNEKQRSNEHEDEHEKGCEKNSSEKGMYPGPFFTPNNPPVRGQVMNNILKSTSSPPGSTSPKKP